MTQTKIIVKEDGQGEDLKKYFKNPQVTVGMVDQGYDIEIIPVSYTHLDVYKRQMWLRRI